jgi:RNA polymerase sigma factor (sigma-70 family)
MKYERGWHIESTPSALEQRELLLQSGLHRADDTRAEFKQNIVPHLGAAYNLARLLSRDADAAQDIVQEALIRAHRKFAGYRGENARAWILKIVRNCSYDWLMSRRRKLQLEVNSHDSGYAEELIVNVSSDECTPEAMLVREAERQTVRFVLDTMPLPLREILVWRELEERSYRQIAEIAALPIGTVMSRLARARTAFRDAWQREKNKSCQTGAAPSARI